NVQLLIRDDGSTDETVSIIERYRTRSNIRAFYETNVGVVTSFFRLLQSSTSDAGYIAFCDQDDVWEKDKLSRAIKMLEEVVGTGPKMYCGRARVVTEDLIPIGLTSLPGRGPSFRNALVQNIAI